MDPDAADMHGMDEGSELRGGRKGVGDTGEATMRVNESDGDW